MSFFVYLKLNSHYINPQKALNDIIILMSRNFELYILIIIDNIAILKDLYLKNTL